MFSSSQRAKRQRGVILSLAGWQRLTLAQKNAEMKTKEGMAYTLEELNELTGLSSHTLTKVRRRQKPVDKQTLAEYFKAFSLDLTAADYTKPIAQSKEDAASDLELTAPMQMSNGKQPLLPEGLVSTDSRYYIKRSPVEDNCYDTIARSGALIRIKAPRRTGKSSLMVRILDRAAQQGCQAVFLSLQLAERATLTNIDRFLQWFCASVGLGMRLPNRLDNYWDEMFGSKISSKIYFEEHLLAQTAQPLVLGLDDVDILFDYPELADEFFGLLRTWHEQAKNHSIWQQFRLVVAHSTEVYIPLNKNKSPFNVGLPIELGSFSNLQVCELAQKYGLDWSREQSAELNAIVRGQPYLVQLGLYSLSQDNICLDELAQQAIEGKGIYANCLQRLLWMLEQSPEIAAAYGRVVHASQPVELELVQAFKLESLGLVSLQGNRAVSSCNLYTKYFRVRLREITNSK